MDRRKGVAANSTVMFPLFERKEQLYVFTAKGIVDS
jgi:hypothetical protein